jgi:hypothetical protein
MRIGELIRWNGGLRARSTRNGIPGGGTGEASRGRACPGESCRTEICGQCEICGREAGNAAGAGKAETETGHVETRYVQTGYV